MKLLSIPFSLLAILSIARAEPSNERWNSIPNITSLEIKGDGAVILRSKQTYLTHILANGSERGRTINGETGEPVVTAENGLCRTLKVGEAVSWSGMRDYTKYKLLSVDNGNCVFEYSGMDPRRKEFKRIFTIVPYPKA